MRDFREHVTQRRPDKSDIAEALRTGQLQRALRKARAAGMVVDQADIDATAKAMFHTGRAGVLLSMVGKADVSLPFDIETLLVRAFEGGDYHNFLKQVHRLGVAAQHQNKIKAAICAVQTKAPREATAWRKKLRLEQTDYH